MTTQAFKNLENIILNRLINELPAHHFYHSPAHTIRVLQKAEKIATFEKVSEDDFMLIKLAALFHDVGFINSSLNHEEESCKLAVEYLTAYNLEKDSLGKICGMIMATKIPQSPKNKLEEILADADLEYLGTTEFEQISQSLYKELSFNNAELTLDKWNIIQINFLEKHTYFTSYGKQILNETKMQHLLNLKKISS